MEIKLTNVTLYNNYHTPLEKKILSKINMTIENNSINAICGMSNKSDLGKLISTLTRPSIGSIKINNTIINRTNHIRNINEVRRNIGYVNFNPNDYLFSKTIKDELLYNLKHYKYRTNNISTRIIQALSILGLDESYLNRNIDSLSLSEQKKVMIASTLTYNPKVLVFDNIEVGLTRKDQLNLCRLIKILNRKYHKTIIFLSNNINFLIGVVNKYYFMNNNTIDLIIDKEELFNTIIPNYMDNSSILDVIKFARNNGSKIENYYEINELIKGVFRDAR